MFIFYTAILLVVIAMVLLWQSGRAQKASGLPGGRVSP